MGETSLGSDGVEGGSSSIPGPQTHSNDGGPCVVRGRTRSTSTKERDPSTTTTTPDGRGRSTFDGTDWKPTGQGQGDVSDRSPH